MAQTAAQKLVAARALAAKMFGLTGATANLNLDDLVAAVSSVDTAMDTIINDVPAAWGTKTIKQALLDNLPEPFKTNSTVAQKALALQIWAQIEAS